MASTFAGRLAAGEHHDLKLLVTIEGIPYAFTEDALTVSTAITSRTNVRSIAKIERSEKRLDQAKRRQVGGGLTVTLHDDAAGTLLGLFAPRTYRTTWTNTNSTASQTTFYVDSTSGLSSPIYVDGETITYTGTAAGPPRLTGCTRGAYGSEARIHRGGTDQGAGVYTTPPTWVGRRLSLIGYFRNADGSSTSALASTIGTFRLEEAPVYVGNDAWEIRCSELADEIAMLKVGLGIRDAVITLPTRTGTGTAIQFNISGNDTYLIKEGTGSWLHVTPDGDRGFVARVSDVTGGIVTLDLSVYGRLFTKMVARREASWRARPLCILEGANIATSLLRALTSREGAAANGSYDAFVGSERDEFGAKEFRIGAGIRASEVDDASIASVCASALPWSFVIDDEIPVEELLADFCLATDSFWYIASDGRLTVKTLAEDGSAASSTIDSGVVLDEPAVSYDEENIFPRVQLQANYSMQDRSFLGTINLGDAELQARYPYRNDTLRVSSRGLIFDAAQTSGLFLLGRPTMSQRTAEVVVRRLQKANGRGGVFVSAKCTLAALSLDIGSVVALDLTTTPNMRGGYFSSADRGRVVGVRHDYDKGEVHLTIEVLSPIYRIAPAALVSSLGAGYGGAGPHLINLSTTAYENVDASPGNMFAINWSVWIYDISANTYEERTITAKTTTSITLDTATTFTPVAGDFITVPEQAGAPSSPSSTNGYAKTEFAYQMPTNLAGVDFETRWR